MQRSVVGPSQEDGLPAHHRSGEQLEGSYQRIATGGLSGHLTCDTRQNRHPTCRRIVVHLAAVLLIEVNAALRVGPLVGPASIGRVCSVMGIGHVGQHLHSRDFSVSGEGVEIVMARGRMNASSYV